MTKYKPIRKYKCIGCNEIHEDNDYDIEEGDVIIEAFNLSGMSQGVRIEDNGEQNLVFLSKDIREFIKRRIERTRLICKLYSHKKGEELAGEINEDLIKDVGNKLI